MNFKQVLQDINEVDREERVKVRSAIERLCTNIKTLPFNKDHAVLLLDAIKEWTETEACHGGIHGECALVDRIQDAMDATDAIEVRIPTIEDLDEWAADRAVDERITQDKEDRHA